MSETFQINVPYKGEEKTFTCYFLHKVFSYQVKVLVEEQEIFFEPDEEGSYRILVQSLEQQNAFRKIDPALLLSIQHQLESALLYNRPWITMLYIRSLVI